MERRGVGVTGWPVGLLNHTPFKANSTRASSAPRFPPSSFPVLSLSLYLNAIKGQVSTECQSPFNNFLRYIENIFLPEFRAVVVQRSQVHMRPTWKHHQLKILEKKNIISISNTMFTCSLLIS